MKKAMLLGIILGIFCTSICSAEVELTAGPIWQSTSAGPYGQDLRGRNAIVEARASVYSPWVWAALIVQSRNKMSGNSVLLAETTIGSEKFEKDKDLQIEGSTSLQRAEIGFYFRPVGPTGVLMTNWVKPYIAAESLTSEWDFKQVSSNKEKRFKETRPATYLGGGVRLDLPVWSRASMYGDVSWLTGHQRYEGGLQVQYGRGVFKALGRHDRFTLVPGTANSVGVEGGFNF